ncbi:hypothetical protein QR680_006398 [Steinernema hermaphroditum]|uniref:AAA+ ATPase domain-containing protein n=1 Tax=Steinernema hermaphroditum TaxID=289476 RepID=A0AA39HWR5_9BILA|nr:hypothetical protein QR680_006398 [Steinernema hermaphroditum]
MDIRRFLGNKAGTSALSKGESAQTDKNVTPNQSPKALKAKSSPDENKMSGLDLLNSSDDSDSMLPKRVKEHMREKIRQKEVKKKVETRRSTGLLEPLISPDVPSTSGSKRRVFISSDEEEEAPKKPTVKRRKQKSPSPEPKTEAIIESSESEEEEPQVPAKRGKRKRTPPGQTKLTFAALGAKQGKKVHVKTTGDSHLNRINAADYFSNFGRKDTVVKKEKTKEKQLKTEDSSDDIIVESPKKKKSKKVEEESAAKKVSETVELTVPPRKTVEPSEMAKRAATIDSPVEVPKKRAKGCKDVELPKRLDRPADRNSLMWVDKYKPTSLKQLVGQNGEKSPMNKLLAWLRDWPKYHMGEAANQKKAKPAPWMAQSDGTSFKAALLSGPPGVGKTTCAAMACKELGIELVETNASDARSKKCLEAVLGDLTGSHQINRMFGERKQPVEKDKLTHVLIMDEVDGMSGNEDRAGISELIQLIKASRVPIICICNDRQSAKIRSLANHCFDLRFQRPRVEAIRARVMTIVHQEGMKGISKEQIDELIEASNHDVRQTIYNLQMFKCGDNSAADVQKKDVNINTFEAARRILSSETNLKEKQELFFYDYGILPLFVYENYLNIGSSEKLTKKQQLMKMKAAADSIAWGDVAEKSLRSTGSWSLLPTQGMLSCAIPCHHMNGHMKSMIGFPSWLGKNSSLNKRKRLIQQLGSHSCLNMTSDVSALACDYIEPLHKAITVPLIQREAEGVRDVLDVYNYYALTKEDAESLGELAAWPQINSGKIQTKVKSALTRALNKEHRLLPYAQEDVTKGRKKASTTTAEMIIDEEGNEIEVDGNEDASDDDDKSGDEGVADSKPKPAAAAAKRGGRGGARGSRGGRGRGAK